MKKPIVTVLMPVFDAERYVDEAIESVLSQSFEEFELIVIDDASTDSSPQKVREHERRDRRVRLIENRHAKGVAGARNTGIESASGRYIAWMDADDACAPARLRTQVDYLGAHPEVSVCGSCVTVYETGEVWRPPLDDGAIRVEFLFNSPLYQPTVTMKADVFSGMPERYREVTAEDYDLWARLSLRDDVAFGNVPHALLRYRTHPDRDRERYKRAQRASADAVRRMLLARLGIRPDEREYACHEILFSHGVARDDAVLRLCGEWLGRISDGNERLRIHDPAAMRSVLASYWSGLCRRSARTAPSAPFLFFSSPFTRKSLRSLVASLGMLRRRMGTP